MIREAFDDTAAELQESSMITGIAGKKGFSVITMTKNGMSSGVIRRAENSHVRKSRVNVEYIPSGIDSVARGVVRQGPRRICIRNAGRDGKGDQAE